MNHIYNLEQTELATAIEIPANVLDTGKAIEKLGGKEAVKKAIESSGKIPLELRLRNDPFEHPLSSQRHGSHCLLLKVVVPREIAVSAKSPQEALRLAGPEKYRVEPACVLESTYRFREIADFQYSTENSPFVNKLNNTIFRGDLKEIKNLRLDSSVQLDPSQSLDVIPPPRFSHISYPFPYGYQQSASVVAVDDGKGGTKLVNTSAAQRLDSYLLTWKDPIPSKPKKQLTDPGSQVSECIHRLTKLFETRPCWTRKGLEHHLPSHVMPSYKLALSQVAYNMKSGPWRSTNFRYGVDPKSSPEFAKYQTECFRISNTSRSNTRRTIERSNATDEILLRTLASEAEKAQETRHTSRPGHEFDGFTYPSARWLQLCDITDPLIKDLISKAELKPAADAVHGWFKPTSLSVIRGVLRLKLSAARLGVPADEQAIHNIINNLQASESASERMTEEEVDSDDDIDEGDEETTYHGAEQEKESEGEDGAQMSGSDDEVSDHLTDDQLQNISDPALLFDHIMSNSSSLDPQVKKELSKLDGLVRQDVLLD